MQPLRCTRAARRTAGAALAALSLAAGGARADTVILESGRKIEGVIVSRDDDQLVVVNPWNSRHPDMVWEIPDANFIPREKVREVVLSEPPLVEYRERAARGGLDAAGHLELAAFCGEHRLKEERERHLRLALALEPENQAALEAYPRSKWERWARGNPLADPELALLEREWLALADPDELAERWRRMKAAGTTRKLTYLERARRSAALPRGRRDEVPLTRRSEEAPGATYCIYVPKDYDPLAPTPLVVGLHGGGRGGRDETLVTGSGESAMNFYQGLAESWGWIVVCPTAIAAPWSASPNEAWMDALLEEMAYLYNVDETRVYLTGHSMGGFGAWYFGPARAEVWAAFAPCAGGGGPGATASLGLPVFIYHGSDDGVVGPGSDRSAARSLAAGKGKVDFAYTELDGVGHGFPRAVADELFRFFAGRAKDPGRKRAAAPVSSFDRKVDKHEAKSLGDPSKLPEAGEGGAGLKALIADLKRGGGAGARAAEELALLEEDSAAVRAVAQVLKSRNSSADVRVLAARALGGIGGAGVIQPLNAALSDEDWRVLDEATTALGRTGLPKAAAPLARAAKRIGERYDASFFGGNRATHTEYRIRLESFGRLADALAAMGDARAALPALREELVERVFTPKEKPKDTEDPRFSRDPPAARRELAERLAACLVELGDAEGIELLLAVAKAWPEEPALGGEARRGIEDLRAKLDG